MLRQLLLLTSANVVLLFKYFDLKHQQLFVLHYQSSYARMLSAKKCDKKV
jgi:hypothetical protein